MAKRKLKPPHVPDQEFLLTTRTEPLQFPSKSGETSSSEEVAQQSDFDYFQGFSFATDRGNHTDKKKASTNLQKLIHSDNIRSNEKVKRARDKKRHKSLTWNNRLKKRIPLPGLELNGMTSPIDSNAHPNRGELSPVKLDLLKEQASRDNRNRTFILLGDDTQVNGWLSLLNNKNFYLNFFVIFKG